MNKHKDRTLPGGFIGDEHPLEGDATRSSTPPPDSFDPATFGAHTVSPSLRMELILTELPDTPEERLYHSPTKEPAQANAVPITDRILRFRRELAIGAVAVVGVVGAVLLQRGCGNANPKVDVASARGVSSAARIEGVVAPPVKSARVPPAAVVTPPRRDDVQTSAAPSAKAPAVTEAVVPSRKRAVGAAPRSAAAVSGAAEASIENTSPPNETASPVPDAAAVEPTTPPRTVAPEQPAPVPESTPHRKQVRVKAR